MTCSECGRDRDISPCLDCWLGLFEEDWEPAPLPPRRAIVNVDTRGLT